VGGPGLGEAKSWACVLMKLNHAFLPSEVCNNYVGTTYVRFLPCGRAIATRKKLGFEFLPYYCF
jgi:hypothetical protein